MNVFFITIFFGVFFLYGQISAHQPQEAGGLFAAIYEKQKAFIGGQPVFELTSEGMASSVRIIQGLGDVGKNILHVSRSRPVVLKVTMASCDYSGLVPAEHLEMNGIFQDVAQMFTKTISFVSMRLCSHERFGIENITIMQQLFAQNNLVSLLNSSQMPLILFFYNGQLYQPVHHPTAILSGFYTRENLAAFIKKKFFSQADVRLGQTKNSGTSSQSGLDLTATSSTGHACSSLDCKSMAGKGAEAKVRTKGFWGRFWQNVSK